MLHLLGPALSHPPNKYYIDYIGTWKILKLSILDQGGPGNCNLHSETQCPKPKLVG